MEARQQRMVLGNSALAWANVTSGVPQGSVLGPALFLIFINDLQNIIESIVRLFADNTKLFTCFKHHEQVKLQKDLDSLFQWSAQWQFSFNTSKCKVMHIGSKNTKHLYTLDNSTLTPVAEEGDLGIYFDQSLKFSIHCAKSASKINSMLGLIRRIFSYMDKEIFLNFYQTMVRPHMEYGSYLVGRLIIRRIIRRT